jgi:hypothetical protein
MKFVSTISAFMESTLRIRRSYNGKPHKTISRRAPHKPMSLEKEELKTKMPSILDFPVVEMESV